jgi:hypothetical protein
MTFFKSRLNRRYSVVFVMSCFSSTCPTGQQEIQVHTYQAAVGIAQRPRD